jgi:6-phosphofructokinase 2
LTDRSSVERAALELVANGRIARVLVSLGPNGALLADSEGLTFAPAIPIEVKSTVGAGDSFLGGFLFGLVQGATAAEALAMAIKAGSAACLNPGTQLVDKEEFERLGQGF